MAATKPNLKLELEFVIVIQQITIESIDNATFKNLR